MKAPKPSRPSSRAIVTKNRSDATFAMISPPERTIALRAIRCWVPALTGRLP